MNTLILLLVFNPFSWFTHKLHHKPKPVGPPTSYHHGRLVPGSSIPFYDPLLNDEDALQEFDAKGCDKDLNGNWFYVTPDGILGYSIKSCLDAIIDNIDHDLRPSKVSISKI